MALLGESHCLLHVGGKVRCNCEKYRWKPNRKYIWVQNHHSTNKHKTQWSTVRNATNTYDEDLSHHAGLLLHEPTHDDMTTSERQLKTTQTHNNFPEGLQMIKSKFEQSIKAASKFSTNNCWLKTKFLQKPQWPFRQAISHHSFSKIWGTVTCYLKITHATQKHNELYYIHFLFHESPGYFYTHYHMLWLLDKCQPVLWD